MVLFAHTHNESLLRCHTWELISHLLKLKIRAWINSAARATDMHIIEIYVM